METPSAARKSTSALREMDQGTKSPLMRACRASGSMVESVSTPTYHGWRTVAGTRQPYAICWEQRSAGSYSTPGARESLAS